MIARNKHFKYIIRLLCSLTLFAVSHNLSAQSSTEQKKAKSVDQNIKQHLVDDEAKAEKVTYDTGETINYLSSRMAYQLKKRLHLTNESDDEAERKAKKKAQKGTFTIFGIVIEKH